MTFDCTSSEPLMVLAWDVRVSEHLVEAVIHFGTSESVNKLKRMKRLPSLEEVKAYRRTLAKENKP